MKNRLHHLITVFAVGAAVQVMAQPQAIAQTYLEEQNPTYPEHTTDVLTRAVYHEFKDTDSSFDNREVLNDFFGITPLSLTQNGYPENRAKRDIKKVHILYSDIMLQQTSNDAVIRTPDLTNPFNSSLRTEAPAQNSSLQLLRGSGFNYDR